MGKTDKKKKAAVAPAAVAPLRRVSSKSRPAAAPSEVKQQDGRSKVENPGKQVKSTVSKSVRKDKLKNTVKDKDLKDKAKDKEKKNLQCNTGRKTKKQAEVEEKARPSALKKPTTARQVKRDLTEELEKAACGDKAKSLESIKKKMEELKKMEEEAGSETSEEDSEDSMTEQLNSLLEESASKPTSPTLPGSDDDSQSAEESEEESGSEELSSGDESAGDDDQVSEAANDANEEDDDDKKDDKKDTPPPSLALVAAETEKTTAVVRNSVLIRFRSINF